MKAYVKPDVFYESVEMTVGVAACSGLIIGADGRVKTIVNGDAGWTKVLQQSGLFSENVCDADYQNANLEDYGYYGGTSAIWGST